MKPIIIKHMGWSFRLEHDAQGYVAICERSGREKRQRHPYLWVNVIPAERKGDPARHELIHDDVLTTKLEGGVHQLQSLEASTPRPARNGHTRNSSAWSRAKLNRRAMAANIRDGRDE